MKGKYIHIGLKDAIFEPSSPLRHAIELYSLLIRRISESSVLFLYTFPLYFSSIPQVNVYLSSVAPYTSLFELEPVFCVCR